LHFLKLACGPDADVQESIGIIERQLQLLMRLLDELRDVSRMARSTVRLEKEKTSLAAIIQRAVHVCQAELDAAEQRLVVELPGESVQVEADADHLAQAFAKLLQNAAKYSEPGGCVTVQTEVQENSVIAHIIDTGIGIDPNCLEVIFDLYQQLNDPHARTQGGLGIGLTLARDIVRLHGGAIEARSDGPGKGSDFAVTLPICE
jgi:signal transduction histidine kinase